MNDKLDELRQGLNEGKVQFPDGQTYIDWLYREVQRLRPLEAENRALRDKVLELVMR